MLRKKLVMLLERQIMRREKQLILGEMLHPHWETRKQIEHTVPGSFGKEALFVGWELLRFHAELFLAQKQEHQPL